MPGRGSVPIWFRFEELDGFIRDNPSKMVFDMLNDVTNPATCMATEYQILSDW